MPLYAGIFCLRINQTKLKPVTFGYQFSRLSGVHTSWILAERVIFLPSSSFADLVAVFCGVGHDRSSTKTAVTTASIWRVSRLLPVRFRTTLTRL